jgi:hypothetical protein
VDNLTFVSNYQFKPIQVASATDEDAISRAKCEFHFTSSNVIACVKRGIGKLGV